MSRLQDYCSIFGNLQINIYPKAYQICQSRQKYFYIAQYFKPLKNYRWLFKFCQSGEISPNLVTLAGSHNLVGASIEIWRNSSLTGHGWQASQCIKATALHFGGKLIHWPHIQQQVILYGGWQKNYYCQQREASWVNLQSMYLRCLCEFQWTVGSFKKSSILHVYGSEKGRISRLSIPPMFTFNFV